MNKLKKALIVIATTIFSTGVAPTYGFVLTNNDATVYLVEIIEDQDAETTHEIELDQGEAILDFCSEGCLLRINGQEFTFSGDEQMMIEAGELIEAPIE